MKSILRWLLAFIPLDQKKVIHYHKLPIGLFYFIKNFILYRKKNKLDHFKVRILDIQPNLFDRFEEAGRIPKHYFFQDLWVAKKVYESGIKVHYDIGSRIDGFIAHCLVFTNVVMLDIRDIKINIKNMSFVKTNAIDMKNIKSNSIESISSLHVIEHIGLGRYGDPVDPEGYIKLINEIQRVSSRHIYISVPIGKQKLIFDSHRIFDPMFLIHLFNKCELLDFAAIDDSNILRTNLKPENCTDYIYGCGLFHFVKTKLE